MAAQSWVPLSALTYLLHDFGPDDYSQSHCCVEVENLKEFRDYLMSVFLEVQLYLCHLIVN